MAKDRFSQVKGRFDIAMNTFLGSPGIHRLAGGQATLSEYRSFLRQTYFYVRENPQLQASATLVFKGRERDLVRSFFKHANSEVGHEELALNDLVSLGEDISQLPYQNPLPATHSLTTFAQYQVQTGNRPGYLGYLFFLEFLPTQAGGALAEQLKSAGVPENAMTFLTEHMHADIGHNALMERYIEQFISSDEDVDRIGYSLMATGYYYGQMIDAAIKAVSQPVDTGWNWDELAADAIDAPARVGAVA